MYVIVLDIALDYFGLERRQLVSILLSQSQAGRVGSLTSRDIVE